MPVDTLTAAFERCQLLEWIPFFRACAAAHSFEPELLMAIGYRESRLDPKYLEIPGDNGHGYGLMQIDIRSYPEWVKSGDWMDAHLCIAKASEILASRRDGITAAAGRKNLKLKTVAGKSYFFDGNPIPADDLLRITVSAYNCGLWAYYHYSKGHDIDAGSTGQNYSVDVLTNAVRFHQLLNPLPLVPSPSTTISV